MTERIRKAVFPVAGLGTRFLPATKSVHKELLPIYDRPAIELVVREAVVAGLTDILFVTGPEKHAGESYFTPSPEWETRLEAAGKFELLETIREIGSLAQIHTVVQTEPLGLGHAVLCAAEFVGDEPFVVYLPDDIVYAGDGPNASVQMLEIFDRKKAAVIGLEAVPKDQVFRYGVIGGDDLGGGLHRIREVVEKPALEKAPSNLTIVGRYVLTPAIFSALRSTKRGRGNEIQLTDAIEMLFENEEVYGWEIHGRRYDTGTPAGWLEAVVETALRSKDAPEVRRYLSRLVRDL